MKKLILLFLLCIGCSNYDPKTESLMVVNAYKDKNGRCIIKIEKFPVSFTEDLFMYEDTCTWKVGDKLQIVKEGAK